MLECCSRNSKDESKIPEKKARERFAPHILFSHQIQVALSTLAKYLHLDCSWYTLMKKNYKLNIMTKLEDNIF